jgi:hypothetical protein
VQRVNATPPTLGKAIPWRWTPHTPQLADFTRRISAIFGVIALILILHIVFVTVGANADGGLVGALKDLAGTLAWGFKDLFTNANIKLQTFLNYGLAALVYLAVGAVLHRLFRNLG